MVDVVCAIVRPVPRREDDGSEEWSALYDRVYEYDVAPDSSWFDFLSEIEADDWYDRVEDSIWSGNWLSVEAPEEYIRVIRDRYEAAWNKYAEVASLSRIEISWDDWTSNDDREDI